MALGEGQAARLEGAHVGHAAAGGKRAMTLATRQTREGIAVRHGPHVEHQPSAWRAVHGEESRSARRRGRAAFRRRPPARRDGRCASSPGRTTARWRRPAVGDAGERGRRSSAPSADSHEGSTAIFRLDRLSASAVPFAARAGARERPGRGSRPRRRHRARRAPRRARARISTSPCRGGARARRAPGRSARCRRRAARSRAGSGPRARPRPPAGPGELPGADSGRRSPGPRFHRQRPRGGPARRC